METPQKRTLKADIVARMQKKLALKRMLFAGMQVAGGAALAFYTYKNSTSPIWPSVYSVIALEGTYKVFKNIGKILWRSTSNKEDGNYSLGNVASGTVIYFGSLYAFSETWRSDDKLWMPFLGSAALAFSYAVSSTYSNKRVSTVKPLSTCCRLAFAPALIVGGATYLLHFRNHEEGWLFWFPLVATGFTGFKMTGADRFNTPILNVPNILLQKGIEKLIGGCLFTASCIVSAVYTSSNEFHWSLKYFAIAASFLGVFLIKTAIFCFQFYTGMAEELVLQFHVFIFGTDAIVLAFLMVKCTGYHLIACLMSPILAGLGFLFQVTAVAKIYELVPEPLFIKYCQRSLGLLLTAGGLSASAYIGNHFGYRYSLLIIPIVAAGIDYTHKGFSRMAES